MARGMNKLTLIGALARDPELRYTPSGAAVWEATVAGVDHITGIDGKERALPWYHRVSVLGKQAEWYAETFREAGQIVMVNGQLDYSAWETNDGGKRSMVRVKGLQVELIATTGDLITDGGGGVRLDGGRNTVELVGNVTRDPELRYTPGGDAVLGIGLAVNEVWFDKNRQKQEKTHWIDVTLWRELAERGSGLKKGDPVYILGRLMNEAWTDRDGNKRNSTKVEAQDLQILARPSGGEGRAAPAGGRAQPQGPRGGGSSAQAAYANRSGGLDIDQGLDNFPPEEEDLPF